MITRNTPMYKALYFDLDTKNLRQYCSKTSPQVAYYYIFRFLIKNDFEHAQGSGYHSNFQTTDIVIMELVNEMMNKWSWFEKCVKELEVTDIGNNSNLKDQIEKKRLHNPEC